ncbi:hypothetical protein V3C99_014768 [Haemonchus contortus]|uniref:Ovule protein n=1 Tax=Haemonchus contortus TaxID=6289 RepID=A0A7I4YV41_HAECO
MMSATAKDTSIFQLLSKTFHNRASQMVVTPTTTEKQQQSLSSSQDTHNTSCSSQAFHETGSDWGSREHFLRLAHVFHTNNY